MQVRITRDATYQETYLVDIPDGMDDDEAIDYAWEHWQDGEAYSVEFLDYNDFTETEVLRTMLYEISYRIPHHDGILRENVVTTGSIEDAWHQCRMSNCIDAEFIGYTAHEL